MHLCTNCYLTHIHTYLHSSVMKLHWKTIQCVSKDFKLVTRCVCMYSSTKSTFSCFQNSKERHASKVTHVGLVFGIAKGNASVATNCQMYLNPCTYFCRCSVVVLKQVVPIKLSVAVLCCQSTIALVTNKGAAEQLRCHNRQKIYTS